jgi:hypothetical protein
LREEKICSAHLFAASETSPQSFVENKFAPNGERNTYNWKMFYELGTSGLNHFN